MNPSNPHHFLKKSALHTLYVLFSLLSMQTTGLDGVLVKKHLCVCMCDMHLFFCARPKKKV